MKHKMLKLSITFGLLASIIWRTTPTNCRQTPQHANINQLIAINIEKFMDKSAKPCENFYQYACGNWYQQYIDQLDYGDTLGMLDYELNRKLEIALRKINANAAGMTNNGTEQPILTTQSSRAHFGDNETTPTIYDKVRTYYRSCKKVKPYNLKKYLQLIQPGMGVNWYVHARSGGKRWQADRFQWQATIAKLRLYGLNGVLLREEVLPRWDEASSYSIYLDKPNLAETQPMGQGSMIELLLDIGQTKRIANEIARQVDAFEGELHRLQEIEDEEGAKEMQLGYLEQYMPQIDWLEYLKQLKGPTTTLETTVIIQNIPYMRAMVKLLNTFDRHIVCNYIMLKFLNFLKTQGPAEITKQECMSSLRRVMPLAMSYIIGEHFYKQPRLNDAVVQEMFTNIKQKFYETLSDNRLGLQQPIVDVLVEKISSMQLQIGHSPRNASDEYYANYFERVELDPNNFYVNQLSLLRLGVEKSHELLDGGVDAAGPNNSASINVTFVLTEWLGAAHTSSPMYIKPRNLIIIPYGFLQMPVYHHGMLQLFKYAVLGFTIAHELLHGFDSSGIDYDSLGNIMGPSEEIAANQRFIQGLRCIQHDLPAGSRGLNEKIADYEGLRLVYETLFSWHLKREDLELEQSLFDGRFNSKQLFFLNYAQFFCGKVHRGIRQQTFLEHALDELRVLQTLANYEEFSNVFHCERRSKMQSKTRCRLW